LRGKQGAALGSGCLSGARCLLTVRLKKGFIQERKPSGNLHVFFHLAKNVYPLPQRKKEAK